MLRPAGRKWRSRVVATSKLRALSAGRQAAVASVLYTRNRSIFFGEHLPTASLCERRPERQIGDAE
jgi:hypothetical protein